MKPTLAALSLVATLSALPAFAQYTGPSQAPATVKELLASGHDDVHVWLKGRIVSRAKFDDLYEFDDGSGRMLVRIKAKYWPVGLKIDDKTVVEIYGEFDREFVGPDKLKVKQIRLANGDAPMK